MRHEPRSVWATSSLRRGTRSTPRQKAEGARSEGARRGASRQRSGRATSGRRAPTQRARMRIHPHASGRHRINCVAMEGRHTPELTTRGTYTQSRRRTQSGRPQAKQILAKCVLIDFPAQHGHKGTDAHNFCDATALNQTIDIQDGPRFSRQLAASCSQVSDPTQRIFNAVVPR